MKRLLVLALGLLLALLGPAALAAWITTGTGTAQAAATTVNQANPPTATRGPGKVVLSWTASTLANGTPVGGYRVLRHAGSTTTTVCTTATAVLTCEDTSPVGSQVSYGVVATIGTNWSGPESAPTTFTFDDVAPVTNASVSPAPNGAGWNRGAVTVTLTATDAASGVDHLTYTVDGGTPVTVTGASTSFPVSGAGNHAVTYFAVDGAGNTETTKNHPVKIDPTAPVTVVSAAPAPNGAGWNNGNVALSFSASDTGGSGVSGVTVDGVTTSGSAASRTVTAEGTTTVAYSSTDVADNVEGAKSTTLRIDKTDPTHSIAPVSSTAWKQVASQTVTITGADALSGLASISYTVDGAAQTPSTSSPVTFSLGQGDHSVTYTVTDLAGNTAGGSSQVRVDNVAPSSTIAPPDTGAWYTLANATITATDSGSGVARIVYSLDGGASQTVPGASASFPVPEGIHTVTFRAEDAAGNVEASKTRTVRLDRTNPVATPTSPTEGDAFTNNGSGSWDRACGNTRRICATATDAGSGVASMRFFLTFSGGCWNGSAFVAPTHPSCVLQSMTLNNGTWESAQIPTAQIQTGTLRAYTIQFVTGDVAGRIATTPFVHFTGR